MKFSKIHPDFQNALKDYQYLTERNYSPKRFLDLIGNRYGLSSVERTLLYRGIVAQSTAELRAKKTVKNPEQFDTFYIDAMNVIITVSSYLLGLPVFLSMDGFLRDAAQKRGELENNPKIPKAIDLIISYLKTYRQNKIGFLVDNTGSATKSVVQNLHQFTSGWKNKPNIKITAKVDDLLIQASAGLLCTSDSEIIDHANCPTLDLARHVLVEAFDPKFPDLSNPNKT